MDSLSQNLADLIKHKKLILFGAVISIVLSALFAHNAQAIPGYAITSENCKNIGGTYSASYQGAQLVSTCTPPSTNDAPFYTMSPTEQVYSLIYYRVISDCMLSDYGLTQDPTYSYLTRSKAQSGDWFKSSSETSVGPYFRNVYGSKWNGTLKCNETSQIVRDAKDLWHIQYDSWFCAAGWVTSGLLTTVNTDNYYRSSTYSGIVSGAQKCTNEALNGSSIDTGFVYPFYAPDSLGAVNPYTNELSDSGGTVNKNNYTVARNMADVIKQKIFGNKEPEFTPSMKYAFARDTFFNSCGYGSSITDGKENAPGVVTDRDVRLHIVSSTGSGENAVTSDDFLWFKYGKNYDSSGVISGEGPNGKITTRVGIWNPDAAAQAEEMGLGFVTESCQDLVDLINDKNNIEAYQSYLAANGADDKAPALTDETESTCTIPGIGWIVCPVFNFLAGITDGMYNIIEGFLQVNAPEVFKTSGGTYNAWAAARNIANVGFVIVFLIIIFSQISNVGVTNYGVKKLLPRLIIAALLVNLSYIVCQLAVDISNILGSSIKSFLEGVPVFSTTYSPDDKGNIFGAVTTTALALPIVAGAGAVALYAGLGLLVPILLAALVAVAVTFLVLVARQALVILLIVVAPLAFLAMLLPNTENYFKQWRKVFVALLLIYPMVALLFGAAHLASGILAQSLGKDLISQLAALAVMVVPLFAVPTLLKNSLNAIPAIGNIASNLQSRANARVGSKAKEFANATPIARGMAIRKQARENYRSKKFARKIGEDSKSGKLAKFMATGVPIQNLAKPFNKKFGTEIGGAAAFADQSLQRQAWRSTDAADEEEVSATQDELLKEQVANGVTGDDGHAAMASIMEQAVADGDTIKARAAQNILLRSKSGRKAFHGAMGRIAASGADYKHLQTNIDAKFPNIKSDDAVLDGFKNGGKYEDHVARAGSYVAGLDDGKLAGQPEFAIRAAVESGQLGSERINQLLDNNNLTNMDPGVRTYLESKRVSGGDSGGGSGDDGSQPIPPADSNQPTLF